MFLGTIASATVVRPTLPTYISTINIVLLAIDRVGVMPVDNPVVDIAEMHSKRMLSIGTLLPSNILIRLAPIAVTKIAYKVIRSAFCIILPLTRRLRKLMSPFSFV